MDAKWPRFRKKKLTRLILLGLLNPEDEGTLNNRNYDNYYQSKQRKKIPEYMNLRHR